MWTQKTTWAGIGTLVSGLGLALTNKDYPSAFAAAAGGLGLIFAADH